MMTARRADGARGDGRVRIALGALVLCVASDAAADGEKTPMFGAAVVGASAPEHEGELVGVELEAAWWRWRLGVAAEGSMQWGLADASTRATVLGVSARVRVLDCLLPSLLEPRDVELGIELHGIVERAWWHDALPEHDSTRYGVGLAVRLRGGEYEFSTMLAESRLFVRVMSSRWATVEPIARTTMPTEEREARELIVLLGIGASFGGGDPDYLERFRMRPFSPAMKRLGRGWGFE